MRKTLALRAIFLIVYILGIVFCIGVVLNNNFIHLVPDLETQNRHIITLCIAFAIGLVKLFNKSGAAPSLNFYKKEYADIIKDSFSDDRKSLQKLLKGIAFYNADKYEKSIKCLSSLLPVCKSSNEKYCVNLFIAWNYTEIGEKQKAIEIYENMIQNGFAGSRAFSSLSNIYMELGDFEKAQEMGKEAIALDPKNIHAYSNVAYSAFKNGNYSEAMEYARESLKIKNDFLSSIKLLYIINKIECNQDEAEVYEKKAVANGLSKKELQEELEYYLGEEGTE